MIRIDQLHIHLPSSLESHAKDIAEGLAHTLAGQEMPLGEHRIASLSVESIELRADMNSSEIGALCAECIASAVRGEVS